MTTKPKRVNTRAIRKRNARILRHSDICHICGEPGADGIDHVRPVVPRDPANPWSRYNADDSYNLKPAHDRTPNSHGIRCNRAKGNQDPDVHLTTSRDW